MLRLLTNTVNYSAAIYFSSNSILKVFGSIQVYTVPIPAVYCPYKHSLKNLHRPYSTGPSVVQYWSVCHVIIGTYSSTIPLSPSLAQGSLCQNSCPLYFSPLQWLKTVSVQVFKSKVGHSEEIQNPFSGT